MGNTHTIKPGTLLRTLREQQNLTVEDISEKTLISLGKLKLLEEDRYKDVGIDLFVCGYIKKYAYIVGADSDQLIADFKSLNGVSTNDSESTDTIVDANALKNSVADDDKITDKSHAKTEAHKKDIIYTNDTSHFLSKIPLLFVVVVLVVIWGAISFFMRDDVSPNVNTSGDTPIETLSPETSAIKATDDVVADTSAEGVVELSFSEQENVLAPANDDLVTTVTTTPDGSDVSAVPDVVLEPEVQDTVSPSLALDSASTPVVSAEQDNLVFSFSDDCWVSVKDAHGKSLFAQLQRSGDNLQLSGAAPFDIQLGNARVATLRVNDQPFSIPIKNGRKTSRFTVTP